MLIEEKWVAVGTEGYRKTDEEGGIHSQDKGMRLFLNFTAFGHYLFYLQLTLISMTLAS